MGKNREIKEFRTLKSRRGARRGPSPPLLSIKIYSVPHTNALGKICDEETRGIVHKYSQPYANNLRFIFLFFKEEKKSTHSMITSRFIEVDIT